jgi:hypothetical protein
MLSRHPEDISDEIIRFTTAKLQGTSGQTFIDVLERVISDFEARAQAKREEMDDEDE